MHSLLVVSVHTFQSALVRGAVIVLFLVTGVAAATQPPEMLKWKQEEFARWKYGMFLHFNMATFVDKEWATGYEDPLLFKPDALDCNQWMDVIESAGMKYAVLTVKHTGGWCLWDSKHTTHDISAFKNYKDGKGDIVREFVTAGRKRGIKVGFYYCLPGKFSGDSLEANQRDLNGLPPEAEGQYAAFIEKQVAELLTDYGDIDLMWFDQFQNPFTGKDWPKLKALVHSIQPRCIVVANNAASYEHSDVIGYEYPYLKSLKSSRLLPPDANGDVAEVCDCICAHGRWFWYPGDKRGKVQSAEALSEMINLCNSRRANYLLNVAPGRDGLIEEQYQEHLLKVKRYLGDRR